MGPILDQFWGLFWSIFGFVFQMPFLLYFCSKNYEKLMCQPCVFIGICIEIGVFAMMQKRRRTMENGSEKDTKKASILGSKSGSKTGAKKHAFWDPPWGAGARVYIPSRRQNNAGGVYCTTRHHCKHPTKQQQQHSYHGTIKNTKDHTLQHSPSPTPEAPQGGRRI